MLWVRGCDTACKLNRGFCLLVVSYAPRSHFWSPGLNASVSFAAQYPVYRHVCPRGSRVLGPKGFWRSVKFLLGLAHLLLPLCPSVLLLVKVWMRPCRAQVSTAWAGNWAASAPAHSVLSQADGCLCCESNPAGPCCQQVALAAHDLLSLC